MVRAVWIRHVRSAWLSMWQQTHIAEVRVTAWAPSPWCDVVAAVPVVVGHTSPVESSERQIYQAHMFDHELQDGAKP